VFHAPLRIDESTLMPVVDATTDPIVLDLRILKSINSYGTRKLVGFVRSVRPRSVEYKDCPSVFVDTINVVRDLLGDDRKASRVRSLGVPFYCDPCDEFHDVLCQLDALKPDVKNLGLPPHDCPKCGSKMLADVESDEFLAFMGA
jgi:hypothetical protein